MLVVSFIRTRWLDKHRPAGASQKGGRAEGPDGTHRDHWWLQLKKRLHFSRVILAPGAMLIFSASLKRKKSNCAAADDDEMRHSGKVLQHKASPSTKETLTGKAERPWTTCCGPVSFSLLEKWRQRAYPYVHFGFQKTSVQIMCMSFSNFSSFNT